MTFGPFWVFCDHSLVRMIADHMQRLQFISRTFRSKLGSAYLPRDTAITLMAAML